MTRNPGNVCLSCQLRSLFLFPSQSWAHAQSRRSASTFSRRIRQSRGEVRPSRMTLSPDVWKSMKSAKATQKPTARARNGPFGGINRKFAGPDLTPREPSRRPIKSPTTTRNSPHSATPKSGKSAQETRRDRRAREKETRQPGDMKALRMQRSLSHVPYEQRSRTKGRIRDVDDFDEFPLLDVVKKGLVEDVLRGLAEVTPTPIQRLGIPALMGLEQDKAGRFRVQENLENSNEHGRKMEQFLLAAETGSGKTLAYIVPLLDAVKRAEMGSKAEEADKDATETQRHHESLFHVEPPAVADQRDPDTARPRAVILLPTAELVDQVGLVVKAFSHRVKLRVAAISASYSAKVIRNRLFNDGGVDVVISTPALLHSIVETSPAIMGQVSHLVVDEADSLFDRSFAPLTSGLVDRATPSLRQLILCSATIPRSLDSFLRRKYPNIRRLATPNLHAIPRRVQLSMIDIEKEPYRGNRNLACADTIWSIGKSSQDRETFADEDSDSVDSLRNILIFVNERDGANELAEYLRTKGVDAYALNRDVQRQNADLLASLTTNVSPSSRLGNIAGSDNSKKLQEASQPKVNTHGSRGGVPKADPRILSGTRAIVATDLTSRGIDTLGVRNVILHDVPHTTIDFIHRLGRLGRMNRRGRAVVLVGNDDNKAVVREVREGMFRGQALV